MVNPFKGKKEPTAGQDDTDHRERLASDFESIVKIFRSHEHISIMEIAGVPPDKYHLRYMLDGLWKNGNSIESHDIHFVEIVLGPDYPAAPPLCKGLSPVFHPNIAEGVIDIRHIWNADTPLANLITGIGEMILFQKYNLDAPANEEAARWVTKNKSLLPLAALDLDPGNVEEIKYECDTALLLTNKDFQSFESAQPPAPVQNALDSARAPAKPKATEVPAENSPPAPLTQEFLELTDDKIESEDIPAESPPAQDSIMFDGPVAAPAPPSEPMENAEGHFDLAEMPVPQGNEPEVAYPEEPEIAEAAPVQFTSSEKAMPPQVKNGATSTQSEAVGNGIFCFNCGAKNYKKANFCMRCGTQLRINKAASPLARTLLIVFMITAPIVLIGMGIAVVFLSKKNYMPHPAVPAEITAPLQQPKLPEVKPLPAQEKAPEIAAPAAAAAPQEIAPEKPPNPLPVSKADNIDKKQETFGKAMASKIKTAGASSKKGDSDKRNAQKVADNLSTGKLYLQIGSYDDAI
ncbi:MAG: ubiquitin-conjugating enzyme E2, partial [Chitinivibrionales bacterium]|nr:ubiquitin-conjugating enzyme E2 [Chitinivibrionales bacterium]